MSDRIKVTPYFKDVCARINKNVNKRLVHSKMDLDPQIFRRVSLGIYKTILDKEYQQIMYLNKYSNEELKKKYPMTKNPKEKKFYIENAVKQDEEERSRIIAYQKGMSKLKVNCFYKCNGEVIKVVKEYPKFYLTEFEGIRNTILKNDLIAGIVKMEEI